jgi:hypothetical protein
MLKVVVFFFLSLPKELVSYSTLDYKDFVTIQLWIIRIL